MNRTFLSRSVFGLMALTVLSLSSWVGVVSAQRTEVPRRDATTKNRNASLQAARDKAVAVAQAQEALAQAEAKKAKERTQPMVRVFPLKYRAVDETVSVLREVVDNLKGEKISIGADVRTNALIVAAPRDVLDLVASLIEVLDVPTQPDTPLRNNSPGTPAPKTPNQLQLRVIWLANLPHDEKPNDLPAELTAVSVELAKIGIKGMRMVSQSVIRGVPDMPFEIQSMVVIDERQINLEIAGTLADPQTVALLEMEKRSQRDEYQQTRQLAEQQRQLALLPTGSRRTAANQRPQSNYGEAQIGINNERARFKNGFYKYSEPRSGVKYQETLAAAAKLTPPRVVITISAKQSDGGPIVTPGKLPEVLNANIQTVINTPYGHYVVLGATPMGSFTSAFIVQLTEVK